MDINNFALNIEDIIEELKVNWHLNKSLHSNNPSAFTKMRISGENLMMCCPFHFESRPSFGIRINPPYIYHCWGCDEAGLLGKLVSHVLQLPNEIYGEQYILKNYTSLKKKRTINISETLNKNGQRKITGLDLSMFTDEVPNYIIQRGISERTAKKYEVKYDERTNSVIFPVRDTTGNVVFIKQRSTLYKQFKNEEGSDKRSVLYGLYYLLNSPNEIDEIYITESEIDTMSCYEQGLPACALMGRIMFKEHVRELLRGGIRKVNLFLDNDKYGFKSTEQCFSLLKGTPIKVSVVLYPNSFCIDANDLLKMGLLKEIKLLSYFKWRGLEVSK